jgi:hypothetical protein
MINGINARRILIVQMLDLCLFLCDLARRPGGFVGAYTL